VRKFAKGQALLEERLVELKKLFGGAGDELRVIWMPGTKRIETITGTAYKLNGEVKGHSILIYVSNISEAEDVLLHEFIEHVIKEEFSKPFIILSEMLAQTYTDVAYFKQEKIIDALAVLLSKRLSKTKKLERLKVIERCE